MSKNQERKKAGKWLPRLNQRLLLLRWLLGATLQTLSESLGNALHQLLHAHLDLDAGVSKHIVTLLRATLDALAAQTETEPAACIPEAGTALALVVGNAVAVLGTTALTDGATDELMLLIGMMRVLVAAHATTFVRFQAVAVRRTCLDADGLTEAKDDGTIAGTTHLHGVPAHALLVYNILSFLQQRIACIRRRHKASPGHRHLVLHADVLLTVTVRYGQRLRVGQQQGRQSCDGQHRQQLGLLRFLLHRCNVWTTA